MPLLERIETRDRGGVDGADGLVGERAGMRTDRPATNFSIVT
jgi:hypothetical protein